MYDVLIIGGGVVGSAMAREKCPGTVKRSVCWRKKNLDVCNETSGRNSGCPVVHMTDEEA